MKILLPDSKTSIMKQISFNITIYLSNSILKLKTMKLSIEDWAKFGRWMMVISGIACICLGLYQNTDMLSWLLRFWVISFGLYCIYIGLFK